MSKKRYITSSPVELAVLRNEQRETIRHIAVVKGAESTVNGRPRHVIEPRDLDSLLELDDIRETIRYRK